MLIAEYDYDTDIAVQRAEAGRIAFAEGAYQNKLETAKILKQLGDSIQKIAKATGLSIEDIGKL